MFDFVTYRIVSCNICSRRFTIFEMIVCDHGMAWTGGAMRSALGKRYRDIGFSFWWNHTRSPENFKGGSVRRSGALRVWGCNPPEGSPEGVPFSKASSRAKRGLQPSEARPSRRAKRGSTEAPPSEARPREDHREVAITKKLKKVPPESPGEPLIFFL